MPPILYIDCVRAQSYLLDYKSFYAMKNEASARTDKIDEEEIDEVVNYLKTEIDPAEHDLMLHQPK